MVRLLRDMDAAAVESVLTAAGPLSALAVLPLGIQILLESISWRLILARLGHDIGWAVALRANLMAETIRLWFPGGAAVAEGLRPVLFAREAGVPGSDAASALTVRKLSHLAMQGVYLAAGIAVGTNLVMRFTSSLGAAGRILPALGFAVAGGLSATAAFLGLMLFHGSLVARTERLLTRFTRGRFASFLEARKASYAAVDQRLRVLLGNQSGVLAWSLVTALIGWSLEAGETWLILRLLGVKIELGTAIAVETLVSLVRQLGFLVPGGIGIQDLGYHTLLRTSIGEGAAMSFVLARRARDVFWVIAGISLESLARWRRLSAGRAATRRLREMA